MSRTRRSSWIERPFELRGAGGSFTPLIFRARARASYGQASKTSGPDFDYASNFSRVSTAEASPLKAAVPGAMWPWIKRASWFELGLFTALCFFWLAPGFSGPTAIFGAAHGIGFLALLALIIVAVLRHEAPYLLLAATLTPVGPVGSVIAIAHIERRPDHPVGG
jgi:hypothetical protein